MGEGDRARSRLGHIARAGDRAGERQAVRAVEVDTVVRARAEFDARSLITRLLDAGWNACLPVVGDTPGPMFFRAWTPATAMQADRHGIQTPVEGAEVVPDLILLPFNAIDASGYRLGYGAGYFDRTLAVMQPRPHVIGVGFGVGVVASVYPQPHDIPVNCRVTETGICHF